MNERGWKCNSCGAFSSSMPWLCPGCLKEVCESCFDMVAHCCDCSKGKTEAELVRVANFAGWDFEEPTPEGAEDES